MSDPKMSKGKNHLINRLKALVSNLQKAEDDFVTNKKLERMLDKMESQYKSVRERIAYRAAIAQARRDREAAILKAQQIVDDQEESTEEVSDAKEVKEEGEG